MEDPLPEGIRLDVDPASDPAALEDCPLHGMRYGCKAEPALLPVDIDHRQADPIERYGAFGDHLQSELGWNLDLEEDLIPFGLRRAHGPDAVDVARDVVASKGVPHPKRALEVDLVSNPELSERGPPQRLWHRIKGNGPAPGDMNVLHDGQADPVHRDAFSQDCRPPGREPISVIDSQADPAASRPVLEGNDLSGALNDPGEHGR